MLLEDAWLLEEMEKYFTIKSLSEEYVELW